MIYSLLSLERSELKKIESAMHVKISKSFQTLKITSAFFKEQHHA